MAANGHFLRPHMPYSTERERPVRSKLIVSDYENSRETAGKENHEGGGAILLGAFWM